MKTSKKTIAAVAVALLLAAALFVGTAGAENSYVAKIGTTEYATLAEAVTAAETMTTGTEIVLINDVTLTNGQAISKEITIDLAGHKITDGSWTSGAINSALIGVKRGGNLTIKDSAGGGSIETSQTSSNPTAAITMTIKDEAGTGTDAKLTVNSGTLKGYYYAIVGNGSRHGTDITINGGQFISTCTENGLAIFHPQAGTLTINGGEFTGVDSAIEIRSGTLSISGGTFTSTATTYSCSPGESGSTTKGAAIAIAQHNTKKPITVNISGGTFSGVKSLNEANPQGNTFDTSNLINVKVTNGNFTGDVSLDDVDKFGTSAFGDSTTPIEGGEFTVSSPASKALIEKYTAAGKTPTTKIGQNTVLILEIGESYVLSIPASFDFVKIGDNYVAEKDNVGVSKIDVGGKTVKVTVSAKNVDGTDKKTSYLQSSSESGTQGNAYTGKYDTTDLTFNGTTPFISATTDTLKKMTFTATGTFSAGTRTDVLTFSATIA